MKKRAAKKSASTGCTFVSFVLDETGSMQPNKEATISGFNEYISMLKKQKDECRFTLVLFNTDKMETRHQSVPLGDVKPLERSTYLPSAMTPLYDAIGACIRSMEKEVAAVKPAPAVIVTIMTDGEENSSKEFTRDGIFTLISSKKAEGWNFVFLGSNQDAWQTGQKLGVTAANTMTYATADTHATMAAVAESTNAYRKTSAGHSMVVNNIIGASTLPDWQKKLKEDEEKLKQHRAK